MPGGVDWDTCIGGLSRSAVDARSRTMNTSGTLHQQRRIPVPATLATSPLASIWRLGRQSKGNVRHIYSRLDSQAPFETVSKRQNSFTTVSNLPWPAVLRRTRISADPAVIEATVTGQVRTFYRDHAACRWTRHRNRAGRRLVLCPVARRATQEPAAVRFNPLRQRPGHAPACLSATGASLPASPAHRLDLDRGARRRWPCLPVRSAAVPSSAQYKSATLPADRIDYL